METLKLGADAPGYAAAVDLYVKARKELAVELGGASCAQLALSAPALFVDRNEVSLFVPLHFVRILLTI
jgi:hypothetical protein